MALRRLQWITILACFMTLVQPVWSAESEEDALGLNIELSLQSAFVFRGYNVFQQDGQRDLNMLLAPGLSWSIPDSGWTLAYWGAFQVSGNNLSALIEAGVGAEQDLIFIYERELAGGLSMEFSLCWYLFPFASEEVAGSSFPVFVEPALKLKRSLGLDFSLALSYFFGLQFVEGIRDYSHLYLRPAVGKSFALTEWLGLELSLGYGYKLMIDGNSGRDNLHDIDLALNLPLSLPHGVYLLPGVHLGWSDLSETGFADELLVWGGLVAGVDL